MKTFQIALACICLLLSGLILWKVAMKEPMPFQSNSAGMILRRELNPSDVIPGTVPILGSEKSLAKIVVFGDYQCEPCRLEWSKIESFFKQHSKSVAVYFRHYPLSNHPEAFVAASIAEKSRARGDFMRVHRMMYGTHMTRARFEQIAKECNLSLDPHSEIDLSYGKMVTHDMNQGLALKLKGTPSLFYVDEQNRVYNLDDLNSINSRLPND